MTDGPCPKISILLMIIECAGHGLIWIQGIHSYTVSGKMVKLALKIYDCFRVFRSTVIHATWIEKDTVACGGHFLTPQVMDVLGQARVPSRTSDLKGVDFFRIPGYLAYKTPWL